LTAGNDHHMRWMKCRFFGLSGPGGGLALLAVRHKGVPCPPHGPRRETIALHPRRHCDSWLISPAGPRGGGWQHRVEHGPRLLSSCADQTCNTHQDTLMECASCGKDLSGGDGRPPAICGGCYSPRAAYCGKAPTLLWTWLSSDIEHTINAAWSMCVLLAPGQVRHVRGSTGARTSAIVGSLPKSNTAPPLGTLHPRS
jgi:hypothetical protein